MALKVAVVGLGNIGNVHSRCYTAHPDTEMVAVCDIIKERADAAAQAYNCPAFYSIKDMLNSGITIDCASMCTAGHENGGDHYQATIELLKGGIPTLGEKPISNEVAKGKKMVALAKKMNLRYGVNLNHRFTPAAEKAKGWIEAGRLGRLHTVNMTMWINNPKDDPYFHIRALHPHSIDVMRYFCGDVKKLQAFFMRGETADGKRRKCFSNITVNMLFKNGMVGTLRGSYDAGPGFGLERCEITGSKGRFVLEEACEDLTFYDRFSSQQESYHHLGGMTNFGETFPSRIGAWIEQNKKKAKPEDIDGSGLDALKAQQIIEAAIESHETGNVITLR